MNRIIRSLLGLRFCLCLSVVHAEIAYLSYNDDDVMSWNKESTAAQPTKKTQFTQNFRVFRGYFCRDYIRYNTISLVEQINTTIIKLGDQMAVQTKTIANGWSSTLASNKQMVTQNLHKNDGFCIESRDKSVMMQNVWNRTIHILYTFLDYVQKK